MTEQPDRELNERATIALMVLKLCKQRGISASDVAQMFSADAIAFVYQPPRPATSGYVRSVGAQESPTLQWDVAPPTPQQERPE